MLLEIVKGFDKEGIYMSITSMSFVFAFLPLALAVYYISNNEIKPYVLLGISIVFYAFGSIRYISLFLIDICITIFVGRSIYKANSRLARKTLLILGVICNVGLLVFYKNGDALIGKWNVIIGLQETQQNLVLPLGISFFTFKAISYLADIYKKKVELSDDVVRDALYLSIFTQIQAGPISRYEESKIVGNGFNSNLFSQGVYRFLVGFSKKVIISSMLYKSYVEIFATPLEDVSTLYAWLGAICFVLQLLYDFEGYSDMAIGMSAMFGYKCCENFNYPFMTESIGGFWRRWHMSLGSWFKDYIYIPLGGSRNQHKIKLYFNLFVVWLLTGVWHGVSGNYILWAMGTFVAISIEKALNLPERLKSKASKIIYRFLSALFSGTMLTVFGTDSFISGLRYINRMYNFRMGAIVDMRAKFLIKDNWFFICIAVLLCFPIVPFIEEKLQDKAVLAKLFELCKVAIVVASFVWALSFVVAGQNNPFAYANF